MVPLTINSQGANLNGIIYVSHGPGPHPTAILLHGYPGNERNLDLAQAIRRSGWNVLFFHYRGAWGSKGVFSLDHALEDVGVAIDFLALPESQHNYRVDPGRIALVGHSMGGYMAMMAGSQRARIRRIGYLAGVNMAHFGRMAESSPREAATFAAYIDSAGPIKGTGGQQLLSTLSENLPKYDLLEQIALLDGKSLLLVGGARDDEAPLDQHHLPLVRHIRERNKAHLTEAVLDADHAFSNARIALARLVTGWLTGGKMAVPGDC
jgi:pimeloyl-ACP methyl ester carboxylesterase